MRKWTRRYEGVWVDNAGVATWLFNFLPHHLFSVRALPWETLTSRKP